MDFNRFTRHVTDWSGSVWASALAIGFVAVWCVGGLVVGFTDSYQIVINTGTTIITFVMVFFIQNSQNRDSLAIQLKLDEIILALQKADNHLINIEELTEDELSALRQRYRKIAESLAESYWGCASNPSNSS